MEGAADYIAADSPRAAVRFVKAIRRRCMELETSPRSGRSRPELRSDLRSIPFETYVIFYTTADPDLRIERILHGARDLEAIFDQS